MTCPGSFYATNVDGIRITSLRQHKTNTQNQHFSSHCRTHCILYCTSTTATPPESDLTQLAAGSFYRVCCTSNTRVRRMKDDFGKAT
jgi:hypothetical protein